MNFICSVFDSIQRGIKQVNGEFPYDIKSFCIGSGSTFVIHRHISSKMADKLYDEYKSRLPLGRKESSMNHGEFKLESFCTMESDTGTTYTFMFPISEVVEHNPNDILDEWYETSKEHKEFLNDILSLFVEKKEGKKK